MAGTYFGDVAIDHSDQARSVFASITITIENDGTSQGTLLTESPSRIVGDSGTVFGSMMADGVALLDTQLDLSFGQSGEFALSGRISYSTLDRSFGGSLVTRDGSNAVIGMTTLVARQE